MIDHRSFDPGGMLTQPGPEVEIGSGGVADPRSFGLVSPFKNIRRMREARFNHIGKLTEEELLDLFHALPAVPGECELDDSFLIINDADGHINTCRHLRD